MTTHKSNDTDKTARVCTTSCRCATPIASNRGLPILSFPRKRESILSGLSCRFWIPAFAGMTRLVSGDAPPACARTTGHASQSKETAGFRMGLAPSPRSYFGIFTHFAFALLDLTTVSINSMPLSPSSTVGKSSASGSGFLPSSFALSASAKLP